jgi:hypothetical protein
VLTRTAGNQGNKEVMLLSTGERVGAVGCSGSWLPMVTSRDGREVGLCSWPSSRKEERYSVKVAGLSSDEEHRMCGHRLRGLSTGMGFEEEETKTRWCAANVEPTARAVVL